MECSRGWALVLPSFLVLLFASFVGAADEAKRIPTTLEGPFKPYTKKFDTNLRTGSDDLPLYDPRIVKRVPAIYPEQIFLALSTPDAMWVSWVSGKSSKSVVSFFPILKSFGFGRVHMTNSGLVENTSCGMRLELALKLIFFATGRHDTEVFCPYSGWVGWLWTKLC